MPNNNYNPDVLNCLANLSNDEVFTPPVLANQMIDLLPQELFHDPKTTFLDPFCKSGVFLREIVKRLDKGLQNIIPDRRERIDHILHQQVFGIAITELTSLISRRSVYCSKKADGQHCVSPFEHSEGNIQYKALKHTWKNGKCIYCGASQEVYDRGDQAEQYAYQFIHTDNPEKLFNMKFDVIIGNPPYQLRDGGGTGSSSMPLYHKFVDNAKKLKPKYLLMIIPARWYAGGKGLDEFRKSMLSSFNIRTLVDYPNSADCFPGVIIAGGVCYFLMDKDYHGECNVINMSKDSILSAEKRFLSEYDTFVRDNKSVKIIRKVLNDNKETLDKYVFGRNSFNLISSIFGHKEANPGDFRLLSLNGYSFIEPSKVIDRDQIIKKYKVIITKAMSGGNKPTMDGDYQIVSSLNILYPNEVCTETYLCIGAFDEITQAKSLQGYIKTKFFRFLMLQSLTSINISKDKFQFVPMQDFTQPWTDEMLYKKYHLTEDEIAFIESMIKPME